VNQIESDMYVKLLLIFAKDKSICFYFFTKTSLLSILTTQDYIKEFLLLQTESKLITVHLD